MTTSKYVSYLRVSTDKQGKSGLGLEAQRESIKDFLQGNGNRLLEEYVEIESGKNNDRPQLLEALGACKRTGATMIIAKLDRLSRNVAFIANLMESAVDFVACDLPSANTLTIHILAAVAEEERKMISIRTKVALERAKSNGKRLGNPDNLSQEAAARGRKLGVKARQLKADNFAKERYRDILRYQEQGMSLNAIARRFNEDEVLTARGKAGGWTPTTVRKLLLRVADLHHNPENVPNLDKWPADSIDCH